MSYPLAPARHQRLASSQICLRTSCTLRTAPLNTISLWSFHKDQATKIISEFSPLLQLSGNKYRIRIHQTWRTLSSGSGEKSGSPRDQICLATMHPHRICWMVSSSWSHRGHWAGWGKPLLGSLSAVQHLLWVIWLLNLCDFFYLELRRKTCLNF